MTASQDHLLIVMADQLTAKALGCYGHPTAISPHIDRLAACGVRFNTAYTSSPLCTPARIAFMTGQYVSRCGGYDNAAYLPTTTPTFAHYLRLLGYHTILCGKMHFVGPDQLHGFETRLTEDIYPADFDWIPNWQQPDARINAWYHNMSSVKQAGVAAITNQLAYDDRVGASSLAAIYDYACSARDRPLCLVSSFIHPHDPYATRQQYWDLYEGVDLPPPNVPRPAASANDPHNLRLEQMLAVDTVALNDAEIAAARRAYFGNVSYIDAWLGRLQAALAECGMAENTTILFTADHGDLLGEFGLWYKMSFREWACRIPLIIANPRHFTPRVVEPAVSLVDVLPTLVALADMDAAMSTATATVTESLAPAAGLAGRNLVPLCGGDAGRDHAVSEYLAEGTHAPMLMLRQGQYKYITCPTDPVQLFDLTTDPDEQHNLAGDAQFATVMRDFARQAEAHWRAVGHAAGMAVTDVGAMTAAVIADQNRRRAIHAALTRGAYHSWTYTPPARGAAPVYSERNLTDYDTTARYPRPRPFPVDE